MNALIHFGWTLISFWKLGLNYDFSYLIDSLIIYTAINNSFKRFKQIVRSQIVKRLYLSHINQTKFVDKIYRKVSITKSSPICCSSWPQNWVLGVSPSQSPIIVTIKKVVLASSWFCLKLVCWPFLVNMHLEAHLRWPLLSQLTAVLLRK